MSLSSFLCERHRALCHLTKQKLRRYRGQSRPCRHYDALESRMLLSATMSFDTVNYSADNNPFCVAVGDFNDDGHLDMAYTSVDEYVVHVRLGYGDGSFGAQADFAAGDGPYNVFTDDLNGDGKLDLLVTNVNIGAASVLLGNGDGTFALDGSYSTHVGASYVAIADFNNDGAKDLAAISGTDRTLSILLGNGDGTFNTKIDRTIWGDPGMVVATDINGDGNQDLAITNPLGTDLSILLGNGHGSFGDKLPNYSGTYAYNTVAGDFNSDGKVDFAVTNENDNTVSVFLGYGDGTFHSRVTYATTGSPRSVAAGDFNGDGYIDLVITSGYDHIACILPGIGYGAFGSKVDFTTVDQGPIVVKVADFNEDGRDDFVTANMQGDNLSVMLNTTDFPPVSHVEALPAISNQTSFDVSWIGHDPAGTVANYDIYVSDNSGSYTRWLTGTTDTSATFTGVSGHTYRFYSRAHDTTGSIEAAPNQPDAQVFVDAIAPVSSVTALPAYGNSASFTVSWSGSDTGGTGIASYDIYVSDNDGGYTLWKNATTSTSATYSGADGHTYTFYSRARDVAGNLEAAPAQADTQIIIDASLPVSQVTTPGALVLTTSFTVSWSGDSGSGDIASFDIYVSDNGTAYKLWKSKTASTSATFTGAYGHTYRFYSLARDTAGNVENKPAVAEATTAVAAMDAVTAGKKLTYKDASGDTVTVTLSGLGAAAVYRASANNADALFINLINTTEKSSLSISVSNASGSAAKTTTVGKIELLGTSKLNSLSAAAVDLTGAGIVGGSGSYIKSIKLRDVLNGADIVLDGTAAGVTTTLVAREVGDGSDIQLGSAMSSATFVDFGDGTIETSSIGTLKTTGLKSGKTILSAGDFAGTLTLSGIVSGKGNTLGTATIAGDILSPAWTIGGTVGTIAVHAILGDVGTHFQFTSGWVTRLAATGDIVNSDFTADGFGTWTVAGDLTAVIATLGNGASAGKQVLGSLTVGGTSQDSSIVSTLGNAGSIRMGAMSAGSLQFTGGTIQKIIIDHDQQGGSVSARTVGSWTVGGSLTSYQITLGSADTANVKVLGSLTIKGNSGDNMLTIAHGNIGAFAAKNLLSTGTSLLLGDGTIDSFSVTGNIDVGSVTARFVGTWTVGGNMTNMDALFNSGGDYMGKTISQFKVTGAIDGGRLVVDGNNLKSLYAGSITDYEIDVSAGTLSALSVKNDMTQSTLSVAGRYVTNPKTKTLGTWKVGGNLDHVTANLGSMSSENIGLSVLDSLSVGQTISNSTLQASGGLGAIAAKRLQNSQIFAGFSDVSTLVSNETIKSITISGDSANKSLSFFGNTINAWRIGTLSATYPVGASDSTIKTNRLDSLTVKQLTATHRYSTVTATSPTITEPGLVLSFLATI